MSSDAEPRRRGLLDLATPGPPEWRLDWAALDAACAWLAPLAHCGQEPEFHGEGDVLTHTRLVCEAICADLEWRGLGEAERRELLLAALLHDVAKPECSRVEAGRLRQPGHAGRGAVRARAILWRAGFTPAARERVANLVRWHLAPFHLLDRDDPQRLALAISVTCRADRLAILARADAVGRVAADTARLAENVDLFAEFCAELGCLDSPYPFPSAQSRFLYFRTPGRDPAYAAYDSTRCAVTLLSGLPAAGKDTWVAHYAAGLPVVSLDALRARLGVDPAGEQGRVLQAAREEARGHLRAGREFVWNATNVTRKLRDQVVSLCASYEARVRVVAIEATPDALYRRNRDRPRPVPDAVLERLVGKWEAPDLTEAHTLDVVETT